MTYPATTAFFGALFALLYVGLSSWVVAGRLSADVLHGAGEDGTLLRRIRVHGNFAEYVPLALLLIAFLEAGNASQTLVRILLVVLLVARCLHPVGMLAAKNSPLQYACRGGGILATLLVLGATAVALLSRAG